MSYLTTDPKDPHLVHGCDEVPMLQAKAYLVLPKEERRPYVNPVRLKMRHIKCGEITSIGLDMAETIAKRPKFYKGMYCAHCQMHRPTAEFIWVLDGSMVGT
jgi:hypothetical protein